jgi:hypothetical protein
VSKGEWKKTRKQFLFVFKKRIENIDSENLNDFVNKQETQRIKKRCYSFTI